MKKRVPIGLGFGFVLVAGMAYCDCFRPGDTSLHVSCNGDCEGCSFAIDGHTLPPYLGIKKGHVQSGLRELAVSGCRDAKDFTQEVEIEAGESYMYVDVADQTVSVTY